MSIKYVIKRDGSKVPFDSTKINNAVLKAADAVDLDDGTIGEEITQEVISYLNIFFKDKDDEVPEVEQIQDLVEKVLIEKGYAEVAKAYILYREQHSKIRETKKIFNDAIESMNDYLKLDDWKVNENSNMGYSLQGLNNFVASEVTSQYWLQEIYNDKIREKHMSGDLHIHDLGNLSVYCCGWDLQDLVKTGFRGVSKKIESAAPKHFSTALMQCVNFMYTLQGECYAEDTEVLTDSGWKYFYDLDKKDKVYTLNNDTDEIELQQPKKYYEYEVDDELYNFKTNKLDLLVTSGHKMVIDQYSPNSDEKYHRKMVEAKDFNPNNHFIPKQGQWEGIRKEFFTLPEIEIEQYQNYSDDYRKVTKEALDIQMETWMAFFGFWLAEGCCYLQKRNRKERNKPYKEYQIRISQNQGQVASEFEEILKKLPFKYNRKQLEQKVEFTIWNKQLYSYLKQFGKAKDKYIPTEIKNLAKEQLEILFEWMMKGDGYEGNGNINYATKSKQLADDVQEIIMKMGYAANIYQRTKGEFSWYKVSVSKRERYYFRNGVEKVEYQGKVYCVEVDNHTLYVRRNGKPAWCGNCAGAQAFSNFDTYLAPFIAYDNLSYDEAKQAMQEFLFNMNVPTRVGFQTPFSNITMDLQIPEFMKEQPVIIGGEPQDKVYGDFQEEVDMFNRIFAEVMIEGDAKGRVFSFPIPTYNITPDFKWDNPVLDPVWEMTAKYGIPYFSNFINSDMDPEDARSMCPIAGDEKVLIKSNRGRGLEYSKIRNIYEGNRKHNQYEIYANGKFVKGKFNKFENQDMLEVTLANGHSLKMSTQHQNFVLKDSEGKIEVLPGSDLESGYYLPYSLKAHVGSGGNKELGYFVGAYAGDGSYDGQNTVVFSLSKNDKKDLVQNLIKIAEDYFGAHYVINENEDAELLTLKIHSKAAVGLCKDFVKGIKRGKHYKARLYDMSIEFRKGVIDGHYDSDGGNRNRIYTSSEKMVESLNMLAATLGTTSSIYQDEREGRLGTATNYAVLIYQLNRKNYGDFWFKKDEKLWVKIDEIKKVSGSTAYCFEVENDEPMFTVGTTGILTHNCRLRLDNRELRKRGGGLFGANPMTGSAGVVTLNLPRIGYLADNEDDFIERIYELMDIAKESLEIKRDILENLTDQGLYPYAKYYLRNIKKRFDEYWKNHFNTIGINGMNEALINFMGKDLGSSEGKDFALKIMNIMKNRMISYQEDTDNMYNLEATPAEGTAYRLAKLDKERFGDNIIAANEAQVKSEGADPYYTNSTHLPVGYTDDIFTALNLQDDLQSVYTGGTVFHGFLGEKMPGIKSTKMLIKRIAENYNLPYYTITPTFSICPVHGYIPGEHHYCPKCKAEAESEAAATQEND